MKKTRNIYTTLDIELMVSGEYTALELAEIFETSIQSICRSMRDRGLKLTKKMRKKWTLEEEELLKKLLKQRVPKKLICRKLDRSLASLNNKLRTLGLQKNYIWELEEIEFLKKEYDNYTCKELGKKLGRSEQSVRIKLKRLRDTGEIARFKYNRGNADFGRRF
ncbi:hypothetical protein [Cetobacterium sp.]|uniref:hypothetical protein n=1 Tax=Cetobacterium sp. TaxID=2071632 RepID=UPI003F3208DB